MQEKQNAIDLDEKDHFLILNLVNSICSTGDISSFWFSFKLFEIIIFNRKKFYNQNFTNQLKEINVKSPIFSELCGFIEAEPTENFFKYIKGIFLSLEIKLESDSHKIIDCLTIICIAFKNFPEEYVMEVIEYALKNYLDSASSESNLKFIDQWCYLISISQTPGNIYTKSVILVKKYKKSIKCGSKKIDSISIMLGILFKSLCNRDKKNGLFLTQYN